MDNMESFVLPRSLGSGTAKMTESYDWHVMIPSEPPDTICGGHFQSEILPNCDISLQVRRIHIGSLRTFNFKPIIRKSGLGGNKVIINMTNPDDDSITTVKLVEWHDAYEFDFTLIRAPLSSIIICCSIEWLDDPYPRPPIIDMHEGLAPFHLDDTFSDVCILVEDIAIPAHKIILASASSVFLNILTVHMKPNDNQIHIRNLSFESVKIILKFLYEGDTSALEDYETALGMLAAAEEYDIKQLKDACEYQLYSKMSLDNVLDLVDKADSLDALSLRDQCLCFMNKHKNEVIEMDGFQALFDAKPLLMCDFVRTMVHNS